MFWFGHNGDYCVLCFGSASDDDDVVLCFGSAITVITVFNVLVRSVRRMECFMCWLLK